MKVHGYDYLIHIVKNILFVSFDCSSTGFSDVTSLMFWFESSSVTLFVHLQRTLMMGCVSDGLC